MTQKETIEDLTKKLEGALKRIDVLEKSTQEVHYHYHYGAHTIPQMPAPLPDTNPIPMHPGISPIYCNHTGDPLPSLPHTTSTSDPIC